MCGGRWGRVEGRCPLFARKGELWEPAELLVDGPEPQVKRLVLEEGPVEMTDNLPLRCRCPYGTLGIRRNKTLFSTLLLFS